MLRRKREVFAPTDGVVYVTDVTSGRARRGIDYSGTEGLAKRFALDFRQSRLRTEDLELAETDGVQVSRKVVTRRAPGVDAGTTCVIGGRAYDVTRVDLAAKNMTLWLSEITTDGTCVLHGTKVERDARGLKRSGGDEVAVQGYFFLALRRASRRSMNLPALRRILWASGKLSSVQDSPKASSAFFCEEERCWGTSISMRTRRSPTSPWRVQKPVRYSV